MEFRKYPSISTVDNTTKRAVFEAEFPDLDDMTMIVQEKLHGSNIVIGSEPSKDSEIRIGRRKDWIDRNDNFFGIWDYLEKGSIVEMGGRNIRFQDFVYALRQASIEQHKPIYVYGEYLGKDIQRKVGYVTCPVTKKNFRVIHICIGDCDLSPFEVKLFLTKHQLQMALVPFLGEVKYRDMDRLAVGDDDFSILHDPDAITPIKIMEGIVIKPYREHLVNNGGSTVMFKTKHPKFDEKREDKKPVMPPSAEAVFLREQFVGYSANANRIQSFFSKEGRLDDKRDLGRYIKGIIKDAREEFEVDFETTLDKVEGWELSRIFNTGNEVRELLIPMSDIPVGGGAI